ncbi:unnamed protein product [Chrysodeixis includens]|uniref:Uncharacterized protein n=1 Tax=Chrysodeixis includens TaxID=689277 RepID=A0A9N8L4J2_CHRIL|nr:unnamed protein product [Chrysodeixis includens]
MQLLCIGEYGMWCSVVGVGRSRVTGDRFGGPGAIFAYLFKRYCCTVPMHSTITIDGDHRRRMTPLYLDTTHVLPDTRPLENTTALLIIGAFLRDAGAAVEALALRSMSPERPAPLPTPTDQFHHKVQRPLRPTVQPYIPTTCQTLSEYNIMNQPQHYRGGGGRASGGAGGGAGAGGAGAGGGASRQAADAWRLRRATATHAHQQPVHRPISLTRTHARRCSLKLTSTTQTDVALQTL